MLLIDTYNVLHVTGVLPPDLAGIDVAGLLELLATSRFRARKAILVCDGHPKANEPTDVRGPHSLQHSGATRSADDVIIARVSRSTSPRRLLVVSTDREIRRAARRRGCVCLTSEQFLAQLASDTRAAEQKPPAAPPRPTGTSKRQARAWLRRFGVTEADLRAIEAEIDLSHLLDEPRFDPPQPAQRQSTKAPKKPTQAEKGATPPLPEARIREAIELLRADEQLSTQDPAPPRKRPAESSEKRRRSTQRGPAAAGGAGDVIPYDVIAEAERLLREATRNRTDALD